MAQYQSYCHINFVLNIKGAGLINKFTAFIAIFTFQYYRCRIKWLFKTTSLFVPLDSKMTPLGTKTQDIFFDLSHKKTQIAMLSKINPLSCHYFTSQLSHLHQFTPTKLSAQADQSYLSQKCVIKLVKNGSKQFPKPNQRATLSNTKSDSDNTIQTFKFLLLKV